VNACAGSDNESEHGESDYVNFAPSGSDGEGQRDRSMGGRLRLQRGGCRDPMDTQQRAQ
jgi:hypothetical protein